MDLRGWPIGAVGTVPITAGGAVPVYQSVRDAFVAEIGAGRLRPGDRLPPTRILADHLGVHRNTLVRSFKILEEEGWIVATPGRGSFVALAAPSLPSPSDAPPRSIDAGSVQWADLLSRAVKSEPLARIRRAGVSRAAPGARANYAGAPIDLARMQPSPDLIPALAFADCMNAVLGRLGAKALGYAPSQGAGELRQLIVTDLLRSGISCEPEDIVITTGSQQGLDLLARTLIDPGDAFFTEARTYSGALTIFAASGADVIGIQSDDAGPSATELDRRYAALPAAQRLKGMYLVPNARNPTGTSIEGSKRGDLLRWAATRGVPIIEDDYGADLWLEPSAAMQPLRALDPNVVYLGTFSKKLMPALRVGFLVVPPQLREPLLALKHTMDLGTSPLLQLALAEYLRRGLLGPHLERVQRAYRRRRDILAEALRQHIPDIITFRIPQQGLALWLSLPAGLDPTRIQEDAAAVGVLVSPGSVYATRDAIDTGLRLTFCGEEESRLADAARRLGPILHAHVARLQGGPRTSLIGV